MSDQNTIVNINTAEREELMTVPGIGQVTADRILEARPFKSIEDLRRVSGIGSSLLESIQAMITVNDSSTEADVPTGAAPDEINAEAAQEPAVEMAPPEAVQGAEQEVAGELQRLTTTQTAAEQAESQPETTFTGEGTPEEEPAAEVLESGGAVKVFTVPEEQTPGPQAEFAPQPAQQAATAAQPRAVTRSQALWMAIGTGFLAMLLAFVLSLGVLAAINGGLQFVRPADLNALGRKVDGVTTQTQILQQDLDGLRGRVNNLEGLSGRVTGVEGQAKQLRTDLDAASQQVRQINQQMTQVSSDIQDLQNQTGRFQGFLDGLKSLLNQVTQP